MRPAVLLAGCALACSQPAAISSIPDAATHPTDGSVVAALDASVPGPDLHDASLPAHDAADLASVPPAPLEVRFLGVGGFWLKTGDQPTLTAPLYTRPSMLKVSLGSIASDPSLVKAGLPAGALDNLRGIVSGHAHYDHLLDVPELLR